MRRPLALKYLLLACLLIASLPASARAGVVFGGDVDPTSLSGWYLSTDAYVGKTGHGTVAISNGSPLRSYNAYLGHDTGASGIVTLDGDRAAWNNAEDLYVGYSGDGTLDILGGGAVSDATAHVGVNAGSTGEVTLADGSTWTTTDDLTVGESGHGTLDISGGSTVSNAMGHIGANTGSTGEVTVDDGSAWTNSGSLYIGEYGSGTLDIGGGAEIRSTDGYIGYDAESIGAVTLDGASSAWTNSGNLNIGNSGSGSLDITDGADVTSVYGYVGHNAKSTGEVTIDGTGSTWTNSDDLYIGRYGSGTLCITDGANVSSLDAYIGTDSTMGLGTNASGEVTVDGVGSRWTIRGNLDVGRLGSGTLRITDGATVSVDRYAFLNTQSMLYFGPEGGAIAANTLFDISPEKVMGTGTINTNGVIGDFDWTFDSTSGPVQTCILADQPGQNVTIRLDLSGESGSPGGLHVGSVDEGSLRVSDGVVIHSKFANIAHGHYSNGIATIEGAGSTWINDNKLHVGYSGSGTLNILNGATVNTTYADIGWNYRSSGVVTVDGSDSTWNITGDLEIGRHGLGTLNITNGATVSVVEDTLNSGRIDFGPNGGTLNTRMLDTSATRLIGTGTINVRGMETDDDLVFDSSHGPYRTITLKDEPGQNVTINLDLSGTSGSIGDLLMERCSLVVRDGVEIFTNASQISASGTATVDGPGATWTIDGTLSVGQSGNGSLVITNGGVVNCTYSDQNVTDDHAIARNPSSTASVVVDGADSTWNINGDLDVGYKGNGTLTIINGGTVTSKSVECLVGAEERSTGSVIVDGDGSMWDSGLYLNIGSSGMGSLSITNGGVVSTGDRATLGFTADATACVMVDGVDSQWNMRSLHVGGRGSGSLTITSGGRVAIESFGKIGQYSGSMGMVTIDGEDSMLAVPGDLDIGVEGSGRISISGGGCVIVGRYMTLNSQSLLTIDAGSDSTLRVLPSMSNILENNGMIRVLAGAGAPVGDYQPIEISYFTGSGSWQGVGGNWNMNAHRFTVSAAQVGTAGGECSIDRSVTQRLLIADPDSGRSIGMSFLGANAVTPLKVTATPIDGDALADLGSLLTTDDEWVLGAWQFALDGYGDDDPVYLSFAAGAGASRADMNVWHYDGSTWTPFDAVDLTYNGRYVSFTATEFSGYAVTVVPEPGSLAMLLAAAGLGILYWRRRG